MPIGLRLYLYTFKCDVCSNTNKKAYKCSICVYASRNAQHLKRHTESVHGKTLRRFKCDVCSNTNKKAYKCSTCVYTSRNAQHLKRHNESVHGETLRMFKCDISSNTNEKAYECSICVYTSSVTQSPYTAKLCKGSSVTSAQTQTKKPMNAASAHTPPGMCNASSATSSPYRAKLRKGSSVTSAQRLSSSRSTSRTAKSTAKFFKIFNIHAFSTTTHHLLVLWGWTQVHSQQPRAILQRDQCTLNYLPVERLIQTNLC
jgi:hypothetical protein